MLHELFKELVCFSLLVHKNKNGASVRVLAQNLKKLPELFDFLHDYDCLLNIRTRLSSSPNYDLYGIFKDILGQTLHVGGEGG